MNKCLNTRSKIVLKTPESGFIRGLNFCRNINQTEFVKDPIVKTQRTIKNSIKSISNKNSQERIRVYDVFQQLPRNKSQSQHQKIVEESREILNKLNVQKKVIGKYSQFNKSQDCQKTSRFLEPVSTINRYELFANKKRSFSNAQPLDKLFKMNDNSISYIKPPMETQRKMAKVKTNLKIYKDDNILELLLLNTCDLKKKLSNSKSNNSSFICVRPGKLPKDFFINQQ